jgi:predicted TPR repeat methyltransferase
VLVGCYRILKPGGWLVFTVEELVDGVIGAKDDVSKPGDDVISGVRLLPSGRFGHSVQHVKRAAKDSGFSLEACDPVRALRYQNGQPVPGLTVVLRKQLQ